MCLPLSRSCWYGSHVIVSRQGNATIAGEVTEASEKRLHRSQLAKPGPEMKYLKISSEAWTLPPTQDSLLSFLGPWAPPLRQSTSVTLCSEDQSTYWHTHTNSFPTSRDLPSHDLPELLGARPWVMAHSALCLKNYWEWACRNDRFGGFPLGSASFSLEVGQLCLEPQVVTVQVPSHSRSHTWNYW